MSNGSFNGAASPYVHDQGRAAFYRAQDEATRLAARVTRSTMWLMGHLDGKTFESEAQMRAAVVGLATTLGYVFDEELEYVITEATATLWSGGSYATTPTADHARAAA